MNENQNLSETELIESVIQAAKNLQADLKIESILDAISFACHLNKNNPALFEFYARKRQKLEGFKQLLYDAIK